MLARVGREIGPGLRGGQLVLSVLAGPTTSVLTSTLGHDQVVRAMPNTPARIGNGMTVWYATPATTAEQRDQARALLGALGAELEVEDEKWVAMATAVSGTGPGLRVPRDGGADRRRRPPRLPAPRRPRPRHRDPRGQHALREAVGRPSRGPAQHGHVARRARAPPRSTSWSRAACARSCRRPCSRRTAARSSWASRWRPSWPIRTGPRRRPTARADPSAARGLRRLRAGARARTLRAGSR